MLKPSGRRATRGIALVDALVGVLIFTTGILGIVGLQATAVNTSADAKYRSDAALLANELIGRMWVGDRTQAILTANFNGGNAANAVNGAAYLQWAWAGVAGTGSQTSPAAGTVLGTLPTTGANGRVANPPSVVITALPGLLAPTSVVTITIQWMAPYDNAPHTYITQAQIGG